jgi:hypothetical protein
LYRVEKEIAACRKLQLSPILAGEKADRKRSVNLPELPRLEYPPVATTHTAGSHFWTCWRVAVALRWVCNAVLCAHGAVAQLFLRALRDLWQFGIATNLGRVRAGSDRDDRTSATYAGVAM